MTCEVKREGGVVQQMLFSCDRDGCANADLKDDEIVAAGGLTKMGWECVGGKHYCPEHRLTPLPSPAIQAIVDERHRQIAIEGWTPDHDDAHDMGQMAAAAGCYALFADAYPNEGVPPVAWPWDPVWWKPKGRRGNLVRAGALIAAEIERLDRMNEGETNNG